jgi:hypothetical protein
MFTICISVSTTRAQEIQTTSNESDACQEQVVACEQVIEAGQRYIKSLNIQLDQKTELAASLEKELALVKQRASDLQPAWYEKPGFVVPATIVATALTVILVRKAVQD